MGKNNEMNQQEVEAVVSTEAPRFARLLFSVFVTSLCSLFHIVQIKTTFDSSRAVDFTHPRGFTVFTDDQFYVCGVEEGESWQRGRVGGVVSGENLQPVNNTYPFFLWQNQITRLD